MKHPQKWIFTSFIFILIIGNAFGFERRKEQFHDTPGYIVVPAPYSLPGIGKGWVLFGTANNQFLDYGDVYGYAITGDAKGNGYGVEDIHIIPRFFYLSYGRENIDVAAVEQYEKRGMESEADDFSLFEASNIHSSYAEAVLTMFNRRLNLFAERGTQEYQIDAIRDPEGELIAEFDDPQKGSSEDQTTGILLDITDDFSDPRLGIRLRATRSENLKDVDDDDPEYHVNNYSATLYIPIGKISTWAFHYFRSEAVVTREGETDRDAIAENLGVADCSTYEDAAQQSACETETEALIERTYLNNKYGTAASLGGRSRLRSYSQGRFIGAHALYYGTEFRWNLSEDSVPFDIFFMKDVRTGIQIAFFYETGSVAETEDELGDKFASTQGVGFRMVTGSGMVYRIDFANGEEGSEQVMIVQYPW